MIDHLIIFHKTIWRGYFEISFLVVAPWIKQARHGRQSLEKSETCMLSGVDGYPNGNRTMVGGLSVSRVMLNL